MPSIGAARAIEFGNQCRKVRDKIEEFHQLGAHGVAALWDLLLYFEIQQAACFWPWNRKKWQKAIDKVNKAYPSVGKAFFCFLHHNFVSKGRFEL
jgi:hypothetical protein